MRQLDFFLSQWLVVLQTSGRHWGTTEAKINDIFENSDVHILLLADTGDRCSWHSELFKKIQDGRCVSGIYWSSERKCPLFVKRQVKVEIRPSVTVDALGTLFHRGNESYRTSDLKRDTALYRLKKILLPYNTDVLNFLYIAI